MYWAMVALTTTMSAALALQFGGWLWSVSPRLVVMMVAIALLIAGIYISAKDYLERIVFKLARTFRRQASR